MMNLFKLFLAASIVALSTVGCGGTSVDAPQERQTQKISIDAADRQSREAVATAKALLVGSLEMTAKAPVQFESLTFERNGAGYFTPKFSGMSLHAEHARIDIEVPGIAADWTRVRAANLGIAFRLLQAGEIAGHQADGMIVYPNAYAARASMFQTAKRDRLEDFVLFEEKPEDEALVYQVKTTNVAGLRLVSNTLEFLDASGTPRLRIAPPRVYSSAHENSNASTNVFPANLAVKGCFVDTSPAPPWGRKPLAPCSTEAGESECICTVVVDWSGQALTYPVLVDPAWVATSSMVEWRQESSATKLPDGRVIVAGGHDIFSNPLRSAEIFEPEPVKPGSGEFGTWSPVADLNEARAGHASILMQDGHAIVIGGLRNGNYPIIVEQFDESTGNWTVRTTMPRGRYLSTATLLQDGRVLVAGGMSDVLFPQPLLFDPISGEWTECGKLAYPRDEHTATRLADGRVVVAGGRDLATSLSTASIEIFDPVTLQWSHGPELVYSRKWHTANHYNDDKILVVAGSSSDFGHLARVEICDFGMTPPTCSLQAPLNTARSYHTTIALPNSAFMVISGDSSGSENVPTVEMLAPDQPNWKDVGSLLDPRWGHMATLLDDGSVLVMGGNPGSKLSGGAERWYPQKNGLSCISGGECQSGHCVDGLCCNAECNGVCNACNQVETGIPDGTCGPVQQHPCGNYICLPSGDCANPCTKNEDCRFDFVCSSGMTCVPAVPLCDGSYVVDENGSVIEDCGSYACNPDDGICLRQCLSSGDCRNDTDCNLTTNRCVPRAPVVVDDSGCACSMHRRDDDHAWSALTLIAGLWGWARRKRMLRTRNIMAKHRGRRKRVEIANSAAPMSSRCSTPASTDTTTAV
jgi:Kelch motif